MNKQRGLLAAIMALVMVFAGVAVMATEAGADTVADTKGPLSFTGDVNYGDPYGSTSNTALGNELDVTYVSNENGGTYTVTGALKVQDSTGTGAFHKLWEGNIDKMYGIAFTATGAVGDKIKIGGGEEGIFTKTSEACLLYLSDDITTKTVTITSGTETKTYTLNLSGVTYYQNVITESNKSLISSGSISGNYYISGKVSVSGISASNDISIYIPTGSELAITSTNGFGIKATEGNITVVGDGKLTIDVTKSTTPADSFEAYGILAAGTVTIGVNADITVNHDSTNKEIKSVGVFGQSGDTRNTFTGDVEVDVKASNRAVYGSTVVENGAELTVTGYERGITTDGTIWVKEDSKIIAYIDDLGTDNGQGLDDRMGLKAGTLKIDNGAEVKTEGAHIDGTTSYVSGVLEIVYDNSVGCLASESKSAVPSGLVIATDVPNPQIGESVLNITGGTLKVGANNAIIGKIVGGSEEGAGTALFGKVESTVLKPVVAGSDLIIQSGSIIMNGEIVEVTENTTSVELSGDIVLSGEINVPLTITGDSTVTVPYGSTLTLNKDMTVENVINKTMINVFGTLSGEGDIDANPSLANKIVIQAPNNKDAVQSMAPGITVVTTVEPVSAPTTLGDLQKMFDSKKYTAIKLNSDVKIGDKKTLTIPSYVTLYLDDHYIQVKNGGTLEINGAKIYSGDNTDLIGADSARIIVNKNANMYLNGADVRAPVDASSDAYVSVKNALEMSVNGDATADLGV
ncbi:MAG: hypothetical protein IKA33_04510, partial [Candidatus Methanomethylophilaceae archaeon]|nr:hypothetical protein [Candidatus Methanomethylophilaceae archaeon]